ncbi:hypothetical protein [Chitinophaga agri]|uniref:Lipoprotein n=1 Tax=Chitinophaga agri TaxID=2703787 RepID=A0A6B9ZKN7_9BACT|nr:hypothetical protein [Chitinophaga agri]QHS61193.1 hypothetical protein GWR21_16785 [Chitinophaga agri]
MRLILTILCACLLLSACEQEHQEELRKFVAFELDNMIFEGENPNAVLTMANLTDTDPNNDIDQLVITANGYTADEVTITLLGTGDGLRKGIFHSSDGNSLTLFSSIPNTHQIANQQLGTFTFEITTVQDSLIEGKFYGTLVDSSGAISPKEAKYGFIRTIVKAAR